MLYLKLELHVVIFQVGVACSCISTTSCLGEEYHVEVGIFHSPIYGSPMAPASRGLRHG